VFVVGCLGEWESAAKVLFESESLRRDSAPSRSKGKDVAKCLTRGIGQRYDAETESLIPSYGIPGNWIGRKPENGGNAVEPMNDIAPCLTKTDIHGVAQPIVVHGTQDPCVSDIAFAQGRNNGGENVVFAPSEVGPSMGASGPPYSRTGNERVEADALAIHNMAVRRLTPMECERLQGFPDTYTDIKPNGKDTPDGLRYKALGNSMAVPVMAWIGKRIQEVENS
jgi:DNA (cytosine-5)-methyltransferase 1